MCNGFTTLDGLVAGQQTTLTVEDTADGHQKTLKFMIQAGDPPQIVEAAMQR